ncbi:MAG: glycosyltransferase family 2 protein, partial [Ignavibacteria bacterium]|nr:glycosyltransferase family 2 protein [Ignavibacteria bacterium]
MQLEACMRSFVTHCYDFAITDVFIIYKATNESYGLAYDILAKEYSHKYEFKFLKENNFSQEVISLLSLYEYVLFLVDDNIFISNFYLTDCLELLDDTPNNLGFSLRLGLNINFCYPLNKTQQPPKFYYIFDNIIQFNWTEGEYDFGYPLEVSSSVYRTKDILKIIYDKEFHNPNTLESILAKNSKIYKVIKPFLFSFLTSAAFCNPTNIVNTTHKNRFGVDFHFAPENLNNKFLENLRIDLDVFNNFIPYACHQEVEFKFFKLIEPKKPLVSVIIPCYNQAVYLEDSLGSVINQTFKDWECIIINDGSTDQTNNKAMDLILTNLDKKILLLEKENGGLSSARNFGIRYSNGSFILPLDADDKIHHSFLEKTVNFLKNNPNFHFVYTDQQQFGKINKLIVTKEWNKREIAIFNFIAYCTLYIKEIWLNLGGYNPNMKYGYEDWDFWVGCAEQELIGKRLPEALFYYRVKSESMLTNAVKHDEKLKAQIIVNHPKIFTPLQMNWAITVLEGKGTSHYPTTTQQIIPQFFYYLDRPKKTSEFKILAIISTFNEEDIIECVLKDFNKNGIDVYIIDDGSTDSTVDIASKFLNINVINIEKFNSSSEKFEKGKYNWELILKRKEVLASLLEYDWFIHADADEFFESPWLNSTLKESIFFVDSLNYNAIYFKLYNFRPYNNCLLYTSDAAD